MTVKITSPQALQCRECGQQYAVEPLTICEECFGPLEPTYDLQSIDGEVFRKQAESGPRTLWRYESLLPGGPGLDRIDLGAGFTPLRRATNLGERLGLETLWIKDDSVNPSNSFKDRVVIDRHHDGARVRVRGGLVRVHRQPGERDRRARGEGRHGLLRVRPGRPGASEDPVDRGVRRQGRARQRELRRREPAVLRGRGGASVGVRQREHAAVLRGGLEVARVRDRRATRVAPPGPRRGADRVRGAADEDPSRVQRADRDRSRGREAVPRVRRASRGMLAGRAGVRGRRRRGQAGEARHDRAVARDRRARRRVLRAPGGSGHRRRDRGVHRGRDRRRDPPPRRDRGRVHGNRRGASRSPS